MRASSKASTPEGSRERSTRKQSSGVATVIRLASRTYDSDSSKPSSKHYTTRKDSQAFVTVTSPHGVQDDYNHYRTVALKSTPDRALSLLTRDVMETLRDGCFSSCRDGDLGENVLVDGITFDEITIGLQYRVGPQVVIEVTEPMIPCANLCKLPYINDDDLAPKDRIVRCQELLDFLDEPGEGFRGWYAKVVKPGKIHVGDIFEIME